MASLFTHVFVGVTAAVAVAPRGERARMAVVGALCSTLPDADVVGFEFGIEYGDLLGHRGLSHSLAFAAVLGAVAVELARFVPFGARGGPRRLSRGWWGRWLFYAVMTASHGAFDAMTDGGMGIAFFSPFDPTRYFLPWEPIRVSPIGVANFFTAYGWEVLESEMRAVWLPTTVLAGLVLVARRLVNRGTEPPSRASAA